MQAAPYLIVEGTVVGSRRVDVPARQAETKTRGDGTTYTTRDSDGYTYLEVGVSAPAVIEGEALDGLTGILTVRLELSDELPDTGSTVRYGVTSAVAKAFLRGSFREWVIFRRVVDLTTAAAVPVQRPVTVAASNS